jgi:hypothetical protein
MKKKITISELKSIIKEEAHKLQRRTLLENEKKALQEELEGFSEVQSKPSDSPRDPSKNPILLQNQVVELIMDMPKNSDRNKEDRKNLLSAVRDFDFSYLDYGTLEGNYPSETIQLLKTLIDSAISKYNTNNKLNVSEYKKESYSVDSSGELNLGEKTGEFFPEEMHFGFGMVFQILTKKFLDKIEVGSIPEVKEYSVDDIDEFVKVVNKLLGGENRVPTGVGAELLKRAMELYLIDLEAPSSKRALVPVEEQRDFVLELLLKL